MKLTESPSLRLLHALPLLLLILKSPPSVLSAPTVRIKYSIACEMCSSCDNPCQPIPSPPPPPPQPPSPPPPSPAAVNCPPPPTPPAVYYYSPPPPATPSGSYVYASPPPPLPSGGSSAGSPPPPNPIVPYFPYYFYAPPGTTIYHSGSPRQAPASLSLSVLLSLIFLCLF